MFCAIATIIERCKTEGVVDVFQVVKTLRTQKPGAVCTVVRDMIPTTHIRIACKEYLISLLPGPVSTYISCSSCVLGHNICKYLTLLCEQVEDLQLLVFTKANTQLVYRTAGLMNVSLSLKCYNTS